MEGYLIRDWKLCSPGSAGPRRWPEGQLSLRAGFMSPCQSAISKCGWGFHTARGGIDPGDLCFPPGVVGVVEVWRDFSSGDKTLSSPGETGR